MNTHSFSLISAIRLLIVLFLATSASGAFAAPATLNDYWNGNADWKFVRKWTLESFGNESDFADIADSRITVIDGEWYLFMRKFFPGGVGSGVCHGEEKNNGVPTKWSQSADVIVPSGNEDTHWAAQATEGHAYYDSDPNPGRWHYLFYVLEVPLDR